MNARQAELTRRRTYEAHRTMVCGHSVSDLDSVGVCVPCQIDYDTQPRREQFFADRQAKLEAAWLTMREGWF